MLNPKKIKFGVELEGVWKDSKALENLIKKQNEISHATDRYRYTAHFEEHRTPEGEADTNAKMEKLIKAAIRGLTPAHQNFFRSLHIKRDGSLRHGFIWEKEVCLEIVTKKPSSREEILEHISILRKALGGLELKETVYFNESTGLHLHFSIDKKPSKYLSERLFVNTLKKMRVLFFDKLAQSNIESKNDIREHYFRRFAKKTTRSQLLDNKFRRYSEFNFLSAVDGKGLEWRSLNALNIKTWAELIELLSIAFDCCEFLVNSIEGQQECIKVFDSDFKKRLMFPHRSNWSNTIWLNSDRRTITEWLNVESHEIPTVNLTPQIARQIRELPEQDIFIPAAIGGGN